MWERIVRLALPTDPAGFWTLVLTLATISLVVVAWRGLNSLRLTRADMLLRAERGARASALVQVEQWATVIIAANREILRSMAEHKVPVFVQGPTEVKFDPDNVARLEEAKIWLANLPDDLRSKIFTCLNRIEAWAMHFTCGIADSDLAYKPCAPTYCRMIVQNYAALLFCRSIKDSGKFVNTVQLFQGWFAELDREERGMKAENLLRELREIQLRGPTQPWLPKPLGTELDPI